MNPLIPFSRVGFYLYFKLGVMPAWSKLYRFLYLRKYRHIALPRVTRFVDVARYLIQMKWSPDGVKELWDAMPTPEAVYHRYVFNLKPGVGDCGAFAIFSANVIGKAVDEGTWAEGPTCTDILAVNYASRNGRLGAHYVTLVAHQLHPDDEVTYGYMDYNLPKMYTDIPSVVKAIVDRYGGHDAKTLGWVVLDKKTLKKRVQRF